MPRFLALLAMAALAPIATSAQIAPVRGPMQTSQNTARGITVNGSALARIPATSARVSLTVMTSDRSLSLTSDRLAPVIDALVKAGADRNSVRLPPNFTAPGGSNIASITANVP